MNNFEERLKSLEDRLGILERLISKEPVLIKSSKKISAKEFLLEKNPKSEIETTFYLAYYLEKIEAKEHFGVEDLRNAYKNARIPLPKNINDTVNRNISKGYLMPAEERTKGQKTWVLTATGEKHAEGKK